MPGAHKPRRKAPPSNESILKEAAGGEGRPRTAAQCTITTSGDLLDAGHVHGEIVDDILLRELHSLSGPRGQVSWSQSVSPSPALVREGNEYSVSNLTSPPSSTMQPLQVVHTPPTVRRGINVKFGQHDDEDNLSVQDGSSSARSSRYSASTATSRHRLIEEAKARTFIKQSAVPVTEDSKISHDVLTPHMRPTGPGMWPDIKQQKEAAAEKRILYKEELDQQISAKKTLHGLPAVGQQVFEAEDGPFRQAGFDLFATPPKRVNKEGAGLSTMKGTSKSDSRTFAVYENEKAITPQDPESKRKAQELYRAELDQQVFP